MSVIEFKDNKPVIADDIYAKVIQPYFDGLFKNGATLTDDHKSIKIDTEMAGSKIRFTLRFFEMCDDSPPINLIILNKDNPIEAEIAKCSSLTHYLCNGDNADRISNALNKPCMVNALFHLRYAEWYPHETWFKPAHYYYLAVQSYQVL